MQAFLGRSGPAFACLELVSAGRLTLFLSREVIAEVADVVHRPSIRKERRFITSQRIEALLKGIVQLATFIEEAPATFQYPRDPKDKPYLNLAIATHSKFLVSRDRDLLDLVDETRDEGRAFRGLFPNLIIQDPPSLLREIGRFD